MSNEHFRYLMINQGFNSQMNFDYINTSQITLQQSILKTKTLTETL